MPYFVDALHAIVPRPCPGRPFVCDGLPENCIAAVIGENPATEVDFDWWAYWNDAHGFELLAWRRQYEASRRRAGKAPVSNTRLRLDRLRTRGVACLETNVFFNERVDGPGVGAANEGLLDLALETLPNIRFLIVHGETAKEYIRSRQMPPHIRQVFETRHFRSESYATIDRIADEIFAERTLGRNPPRA